MRARHLFVIVCLLAFVLSGCTLPEEHRFINPTESISWEPTEPAPTTAPAETTTQPTVPPSIKTAEDLADDLSLSQQVAQLFLVKCPADGAAELLEEYQVGGIILFGQDTAGETPASLKAKLDEYQSYCPIPLIVAVDEEGGDVNRVSSRPAFRSEKFESPREIYLNGGLKALRETEAEKAQLLKRVGINVNLAPVCDVVTEDNAFMADRSLRLTEKATGEAVAAMVKTMQQNGVGAVLKHFPGYGNLTGDTHTGAVNDPRSLDMLKAYDFVPFRDGIKAGAGAVMVNHSISSNYGGGSPATLSEKVHLLLRNDLGFKGVIMTDDLDMGAISNDYTAGEAAVLAVLAGNDMLITSWNEEQFNAVLYAADTKRIPREQLRQSVIRILQWKMDLGLL